MARLQATVDDKTLTILDNLFRRNDRARFIELAIKCAENNPEIRGQFSWKNQVHTDINDVQHLKNNVEPDRVKSKVKFDKEF